YRGFVTKAIYSDAFKDPSNFEKFATLPGILDRPDGDLQPERARNFEVSAGRQWNGITTDVALYRTTYSDLVTLAPHTLGDDPDVKTFLNGVVSRLSSGEPDPQLDQALRAEVSTAPVNVLRKVFDDPIFIERFENAGALRVWGVQAMASYQLRGI